MLSKGKSSKFKPFDVSIAGGGTVDMSKTGMTSTESQFDAGARNFFQNQFTQATGDSLGQRAFGGSLVGAGQAGFMPQFAQTQNQGFDMSNAGLPAYLQQLSQQQGMFGQMGMQGMGAAFNGPSAAGLTNQSAQMGMGLFNQFGDFNQISADRKAGLDAQALPQEQQAARSAVQGLFSSGRLGTTGGANMMGQLNQAQNQADLGRGLAAQSFAQQQQAQMLGLGQGFMGQAFQGTGMDQNQAMGLGGLGFNFLSQMPQFSTQGFNAMGQQDTRNISRAQDRLSNMQGLFGFGQEQMEAPTGAAARAIGAIAPLDAKAFDAQQIALQGAGLRSKQGASAGNSALGGALAGLGQGLFSAGMNNFFDRQNNKPPADKDPTP